MKRWIVKLWVYGCVGLVLSGATCLAADVDEEEFQRLKARASAHDESIEVFRQSLQRLESEIRDLRTENRALRKLLEDRPEPVTQDQLRKVTDQVREVDRKRLSDNQVVLEALSKLERLVTTVPPPPPPPVVPAEKPAEKPVEKPAEPIAKEGWVHTVERGQSVGTILDAYRKEYGLKTSLDDLRKANPNIRNLNLVRPGQDIIIPDIR